MTFQFHQEFSNSTITATPGVPEREQNCPMLDKHPVIKQLIFIYNTCLQFSASDERLFSTDSLVFRKRSDKLLETLAMLKVNQHYW